MESVKRKIFLNQWFVMRIDGCTVRAKVVDVEFETDIKQPLFLFETKMGRKFWLTRSEVREYETTS